MAPIFRMIVSWLALAAALVAMPLHSSAATFVLGNLSLQVPPGFSGPESETFEPNVVTFDYVRPHPSGRRSTLLQITSYRLAYDLPPVSGEHLGGAAESYLQQVMDTLQRRRRSFRTSAPARLSLGGLPAARIAWTGLMEQEPMHGVMYGVILEKHFLTLHVQDFDDAPSDYMNAAIGSIEALRIKATDEPETAE